MVYIDNVTDFFRGILRLCAKPCVLLLVSALYCILGLSLGRPLCTRVRNGGVEGRVRKRGAEGRVGERGGTHMISEIPIESMFSRKVRFINGGQDSWRATHRSPVILLLSPLQILAWGLVNFVIKKHHIVYDFSFPLCMILLIKK